MIRNHLGFNMNNIFPEDTSQTIAVLSLLAVIILVLHDVKQTELTLSVWPFKVFSIDKELTSQTIDVKSRLDETNLESS
jgi:hypothetical protein